MILKNWKKSYFLLLPLLFRKKNLMQLYWKRIIKNWNRVCTKWHDEIDKFVNNLQNETDEISDIQLKAPNKHLQKVKFCTKIQDTIKGNKDLLKSTNVTKIFSYKSKNSLLKCYPEEFDVSIPRFITEKRLQRYLALLWDSQLWNEEKYLIF